MIRLFYGRGPNPTPDSAYELIRVGRLGVWFTPIWYVGYQFRIVPKMAGNIVEKKLVLLIGLVPGFIFGLGE